MIAFDEVVIALFICGSTAVTLPKKMWDVIRYEIEPMLPAISALLLLLAAFILVLIGVLQKAHGAPDDGKVMFKTWKR